MKPLIVGEAPSKWMHEHGVTMPFVLARKDLASLCGTTVEDFNVAFECVNVLDRWPGKQGKGDAFPWTKPDVDRLWLTCLKERRRCVLLGKRVGDAFGLRNVNYFESIYVNGVEFTIVPHPSKVNRWWNDPTNRAAAIEFWNNLWGGIHGSR